MRTIQENYEKRINGLVKEAQKYAEENDYLKIRIGQMIKEVQNLTKQNNFLKFRIGQMEANVSMRYQETIKHSLKIENIEENLKYLIGKTNRLENRLSRDNLRITVPPETHD